MVMMGQMGDYYTPARGIMGTIGPTGVLMLLKGCRLLGRGPRAALWVALGVTRVDIIIKATMAFIFWSVIATGNHKDISF